MKVRLASVLSALAAGSLMLLGASMVNDHEQERHLFREKTDAKDHLSLVRAKLDGAIQKEIQLSKSISYYTIQNPVPTVEDFREIAALWLTPRVTSGLTTLGLPHGDDSIEQVTLLRPGRESYIAPGMAAKETPPAKEPPADFKALQQQYEIAPELGALPPEQLRDRLAIGGIHLYLESQTIHIQIAIIDEETQATPLPRLWGVIQTTLSSQRLLQQIDQVSNSKLNFQGSAPAEHRYLIAQEVQGTGDYVPIFGDATLLDSLGDPRQSHQAVIETLQFPKNQWVMIALPEEGWFHNYQRSIVIYSAGFLFALAVATLVYRWADAPVRLRSEVSQQQKRFQEIFEQAAVGIYRTDETGSIIEVNQRLCQLVGYTEPEIIGLDMMGLTHPDDRRSDWPTPWYLGHVPGQMAPHQGTYNFATRFVRKSGQVQWVNLSISLACDDDHAIQYAIVVVEDIGDRKQAEASLRASEERWQLALQGNNDGIWDWDPQTNEVFYSSRWKEMLGYLDQEVGNTIKEREDRIHPEDRNHVFETLQAHLKQELPTYGCEYRLRCKGGEYKWVLDRGQALWDKKGTVTRMVGSCTDINDRKQAEANLRSSEERFRAIVEQAAVGISQLDRDGYYVKVNEKFCSLLGYHESELLGKNYRDITYSEDLDDNMDFSQQLWQGEIPSFSMEKRYVRKDKGLQWTNVTVSLVSPSNQEAAYTIAIVEDISARKEAEEKLTYTAFYDTLTELPNRNLFIDRLQGTLRKSQRHLNRLYSVLYIDLDRFKVVNDSLGHHAGDDLLVQIGRRLLGCVRGNDMVARLGGDEFAILLDDVESVDDATNIADRIQDRLRHPFRIQNHDFYTSASIGIALSIEPTSQCPYHRWESWMRDADIAMYAAKRKGKACYQVFDASMHQATLTQLHIENDLRQAIAHGELDLYFQPIVCLQDLTLKGFEALVRWNHPQRGWVSPSDFVAVAEETDLILQLGQWVLETACQKIRVWHDVGWMKPGMTVNVNISGRQFTQPKLVERIHTTVLEGGVDPAHLRIEVTETAITENLESVIDRLARLQTLGIQSCIDDFGTGYSSLSRLQSFPIHALKVDQSFVQRMGDEEGIAIVRTILNLARGLRMSTVAEGIETLDQLTRLKGLGCDFGQGYLFSRPLNATQAEFLLQGKMDWQGLQINGAGTITPVVPSVTHPS